MRACFATTLCLILIAILCSNSFAAVFHVPGDQPSILAGVMAAVEGDTVLVAPGTYTGPANRAIEFDGKNISVIGSGGSDLTIIDCQGGGRAFYLRDGETHALIQGFTIINGYEFRAGAIRFDHSGADLHDLRILDCRSSGMHTGGIFASDMPWPRTFSNLLLARNVSNSSAGAMYISDSNVELINSTFVDNEADDHAGAIQIGGSDVHMSGLTLVGNNAGTHGGAIAISTGTVTIENSIVAFNESLEAAIYDSYPGGWSLLCSDVYGNVDGDYLGTMADQTGVNGNISLDPLFCDAAGGDFTLDAGSPCLPPHNNCLLIMGAYGLGCGVTGIEAETAPVGFALDQNHPNPFNPRTEIVYMLPAKATVDLTIYDGQGRRVACPLAGIVKNAGTHRLVWEARDENGQALASGVYFYRLDAGEFTATRKMILLK